jgi:hypothetical protein
MREIAEEHPVLTRRTEVDPAHKLTKTLGEYNQTKLDHYATDIDTRYDADLLRIFSDEPRHRNSRAASSFIRSNRAAIREAAHKWSGGYQVALDNVLDQLIDRARALKLRAPGNVRDLRQALIRLLSRKIAPSIFRAQRRQWFAL